MSEAVTRIPASGLPVVQVPGSPVRLTATARPDRASLRAWLVEHRAALRIELLRHGHLLVRGLPMADVADFATIRDVLVDAPAEHRREETTPRSTYGSGVFSATDLPASQAIRLHNEDSYSVVFPGLLLFGCLTAPQTGGATTIGDVRRIRAALPADLVDRFRDRGWLVVRTFTEHIGLSWQRAFGTEDPAMAEEYCDSQQVGWEWLPGNRMRTTGLRAATVRHPVTGAETWFNHVAVFNEWTHDPDVREVLIATCGPDSLPQNTYYGDGEPIEPDVIATLNRAYDEATVPVQWQSGDLLLVDNLLSAHGRTPYRGTREVVVAMGDPLDIAGCAPSGPIGPAPRARKET